MRTLISLWRYHISSLYHLLDKCKIDRSVLKVLSEVITRLRLLTWNLNRCQTLTNYGDFWRHGISHIIYAEIMELVCLLYLITHTLGLLATDYWLQKWHNTRQRKMTSLTIYFCQLNFAVKVSLSFDGQILDNFDVTKKSKTSFFHNKAIFEMTLPVHTSKVTWRVTYGTKMLLIKFCALSPSFI